LKGFSKAGAEAFPARYPNTLIFPTDYPKQTVSLLGGQGTVFLDQTFNSFESSSPNALRKAARSALAMVS